LGLILLLSANDRFGGFFEYQDELRALAGRTQSSTSDVEHQQVISAEIDNNIISISDITNENVVSFKQTAHASEELATLALDFRTLVKEFKI